MILMDSLVSQMWVLPPFIIFYVGHKPSYRAKYLENGGHFEIQNGG